MKNFAFNDKISLRQVQALLFLAIFGFGITALPRRVAEFAGQDGWLGVLLATLVAILLVWIISSVTKMHQGLTFYEYVCKILTKPIGILVCLFLSARLILLAAFNLRIFAEITQNILLPTTPSFVIFAAILILAAYGASKGMEARARLAEILLLIAIIPLIAVFALSVREIDFTNLLPMFNAPLEDVGRSGYSALFAFNGLDMLLLISPFLARPKNLGKSAKAVVATMGGFMLAITTITIARFGAANITHHTWPVLKMMDTASMPGAIIDRQGALIMTFWIISAYAIINAALFFSSLLLKNVAKAGKHTHYILICLPIIAIIAALPVSLEDVYAHFNAYNNIFGVGAMVVLPIILLIVGKIRGGVKNAK